VKSRGPHRWNAFGERTARSLKQAARARSQRRDRSRTRRKSGRDGSGANHEARRGKVSTKASARGPKRAVPPSQSKDAEGQQPTRARKRERDIERVEIASELRRTRGPKRARVKYPATPRKHVARGAKANRATRANPARTGSSLGKPRDTGDAHARLASRKTTDARLGRVGRRKRGRQGRGRDVRRSHAAMRKGQANLKTRAPARKA